MKRAMSLIFSLIVPFLLLAGAPKGYYRYPSIHGDIIVFTSEGDLWKVAVSGGIAQRLTTHHGLETHAAISPDGKSLAFTGRYEGPAEIYTMPLDGGLPTRRSYEGETALVVSWTSDGRVMYSTRHYSTLPDWQLGILNLTTGETELIPLAQANDGSYDTAGESLFFTRLPAQGSQTKRYKGGTAQNIWKFSQGAEEAEPLTGDYAGTSKVPMWWQDRVYFASDRDGTMNLWSMDTDGGDLRQHTHHRGWDVQTPALHAGKIVYQLGADLHLYDIPGNQDQQLEISLASDFDQMRTNWITKPMQYLDDAHISPEGQIVALTARGRVFVAPVKEGRFVEVTRKQGVRYRNARFLPDKKSLLLLSDQSGEQEFWKYDASGLADGQQLTSDADVLRNEATPSHNGTLFTFTDRDQRLWIYDFKTKQSRQIDSSNQWNFSGMSWSPDNKWLAYTGWKDNYHQIIKLHNVETGSKVEVTSERVDSYAPAWSRDGKWLFFLSDRHFESVVRSPWGPRQPEPFLDKTTKIYALSLQKGLRFPFTPKNETHPAEPDADKDKDKDKGDKKAKEGNEDVVVIIDLDGLSERVMEVPVPPGNYSNLVANKKRLFYTDTETGTERKTNLVALDIKDDDPKPETLVKEIKGYELSMDGENLLIYKDSDLYVIEASSGSSVELNDHKLDLGNWNFAVNPKEEWRQMFVDAWRLERDYFYDPDLHSVDWQGLLDKHLPLVERVADRSELNDLIAQLVAELSALHIFVVGGDQRQGDDDISLASLGTRLKRDQAGGGYRIEHIYRSEPDYLDRRGPLSRPDLDIQEGDVIVAINGVATLDVVNPRALLKNQAGEQVLLSIKSATTGEIQKVVVEPISPQDEARLRYDEWEHTRRLLVDEKSAKKIGYVHMRAMGGNNYSEWVRNFYPVYNRQGLIIDMRHNRGGNIDSWILEKLMRKAWFYWKGRVGEPYWNMQYAFRGHMVVLCNEYTASDGEAFTEGFRRLRLGKVIGTRTWGGEIWLSFSNWLVDRGIASAAEYGVYGPEGEWLIEGHGVEPDIEVDNLPHESFRGRDAQLEAAISHLLKLIEEDPRPVPPPPPYPDKSFDYEKITNGRMNEEHK